MLVRWCTAAEKLEGDLGGVGNLVSLARRDGDGVPRANILDLLADLHPTASLQDVVDFLSLRMVVWLGRRADWESGFRETLFLDF